MTADVIRLARGGRGRGQQRVVAMSEDLVEPWMEVKAIGDETASFATAVLGLARAIESAIARDRPALAATYAHELEQLAPRVATRALISTSIALERLAALHGIACVDAIAEPGHGAAA